MRRLDLSNFGQWIRMWTVLNTALFLFGMIDLTMGHGRLWEPPSRSSMWRRGYNTTVNINDNELSCGGFTNQWILYNGLCGVCGDPYQQHPRDNEVGGKYASAIITRTYPIGGKIDVVIGLTANHMGYFEFKLCPILDPASRETQACMDSHQLKIFNGEDNGYKFYIRDQKLEGHVKLTLMLPRNFLCQHCVLQWRYRTGTRWGCDDHSCGKGKGPQEEFYGCSDISIEDVSRTIYNEPPPQSDRDKGRRGLNHLGAMKPHTVIWSIEPTQQPYYRNSKYTSHPEVVAETQTPSPLGRRHNKHMATLRHFLEELTLNALFRYYGNEKEPHKHVRCSAAKKYKRNPIVNEFCRKVCSKDISTCPEILCTCLKNQIPTAERQVNKSPRPLMNFKNPFLDRSHLKKFVRKLVTRNRLVDTIPTSEFQNPTRIRPDIHKHHRSETSIPRIGKMEVVHAPPKRIPIGGSIKALQEDNFISIYDVKSVMTDTENDLNKFMTKKGLDFSSTFDPDKVMHLQSQQIIEPKIKICTASAGFSHNPFMAKWCNTNCKFGFCPPRQCSCNY